MKLELLGHPKLIMPTGARDLPFTKPAYLLLYLACRADWVTRDELALFFRPDADEKTARHNLRLLLTRARKFDWAENLEGEGDRLRFLIKSDVHDFRAALGRADWQRAVQLYKGDFLERAPSLGLVTFETWLEVERSALASSWQGAALKHAAQLSEGAKHLEAAHLLAQVLQREPLAEDVLQMYLRSSYLVGDAATALKTFHTFKKLLKDELDLVPLAETETLAATIERSEMLTSADTPKTLQVPLAVLRPPLMIGRSQEKAPLLNSEIRLGLISGEAGVGKSRFLSELAHDALWLRCREGLTHVPYFPLIEAVKALKPLPDVGAYKNDLASLIPELAPGQLPPQDSETAKARRLEALALALESQETPLIFDNLQWADSATLEFFVFMVHRASLKLYAAVRSNERSEHLNEVLNGLRSTKGFRELELAPLNQETIGELVASLSPETGEAKAFSSWLFEKSGGNPFFLLETLRALFEAQVLSEGNSGWYSSLDSVTNAYAELALPPGVAALVERRVKGLSQAARRVLDVAAVLAEGITAALSARLTGLSVWAASDALAELELQGLITRGRFSHDLVRQVLYKALPESRRRFLHEQIADALEGVEDELVRAEHYYQAGALNKAAELWFHVARFRFGEGHFEAETIALYERIISLELDTPAYYRAQAYLADRYHALNRQEEKMALITNVLDNSDDPLARTFALLQKTISHFLAGEMAESERAMQAAERQAADFDDKGLQRDLALNRVYLDQHMGKVDEALELAEHILAEKRLEPPDFGFISWLSTKAYVYCTLGRFEEALELYYEQLSVAKELKFVRTQAQAASDIMATLYDLGRVQEGLELGEAALKLGEFDVTFPLRYHLALAYFEQKRFEDVLRQSEAIFAGNSSLNIKSHTYALLAEVYAVQDCIERSLETLDRGLDLVETSDHNDAKAMMAIATLKFGSNEQLRRIKPILAALAEVHLPAYIQADYEAALALGRHDP